MILNVLGIIVYVFGSFTCNGRTLPRTFVFYTIGIEDHYASARYVLIWRLIALILFNYIFMFLMYVFFKYLNNLCTFCSQILINGSS